MPEARPLWMGLADEQIPGSSHVCLIYESDQQRQQTVSSFLAAGISRRELVRYFTDVTTAEQVRAWLAELGVEVRAAEQRGAFSISSAESAYCPRGCFEPEAMISGTAERYAAAAKAGFSGVRSTGEMSWVLKGAPGSERFLEYEALLNGVSASFPHSGMCQYDTRLFDGATLFKILQVHPFMVAHGQIVRNPDYQAGPAGRSA